MNYSKDLTVYGNPTLVSFSADDLKIGELHY